MVYQQQIQETEDIHKPFREAFLRFVVSDYALHHSIKSMAHLSKAGVDHIEINIGKNPYSIDVTNIGELNRALNRSRFSCINWNNLFSKDPTVCDREYDRLEEFLRYYFDMDKQFLENCVPIVRPARTDKPTEMKSLSLMQEDNSMSISIENVIEGNGSVRLTIKDGTGKQQEYNLISEKVADSSNVDKYYFYYNKSEMQKYKIATHYAYYRTDLFLQGMISFRIRFPNSRKELAPTTEEQDDSFSKLEFDVTNEIERITGTAPPYNVVRLLLRIFYVIFSPLPNQNSEKWIVEDLMPSKRDAELYSQTTANMMEDVRPLPPIAEMTDAAGLSNVRNELADLIRSAPAESIDTFGDIISICKSLFDDSSLSDELRFLDSQLPTVTSRFLVSQATASQEDRTFAARDMVQDFLEKAITKERLSDLHDLIASDSITNRTLYFFRSLTEIVKSKPSSLVKTNANLLCAKSSWYDLLLSYRLDFLYVLYWALTSDTKLYKLYLYIHDRMTYHADPKEYPKEYAPALFIGSLVDNGSNPLDTIYLNLKRQNKELDQTLASPGMLERLLFAYRGRAI
jgi:hypothetical protein